MKNLKFLKEPGYMYDLFFLFVLNFNRDYCLANFINFNKASDDTEYFDKVLSGFDSISEDLFPFFYVKDNGKCCMTQFYYEVYAESFAATYNLSAVQMAITDYDQVIENVIRFYFKNIADETLAECKSSVTAVGKLIKNSGYSAAVKSSLYSFFLDPVPAIQKLGYELMTKGFQLEQQYEKSFRKIAELQYQIDIEQIAGRLKQCENQKCDLDGFDEIGISICLLHKNCIKLHFYFKEAILLLGADYVEYIDYIINQHRLPELDVFGNAMSEANRIEILDLIVRKEEITIRDIEQELGFTGTNAYYHLSLMIKANMIKSRNQGRTILYSINKSYFNTVCNMLGKYTM